MIGDINPNVRGLQVWVKEVRSCRGEVLPDRVLGTNQSIRWAGDCSTQILDGTDIFKEHKGIISDNTHGILLEPKDCCTNNGTKGNPCLIADIFGDFREELLLRAPDLYLHILQIKLLLLLHLAEHNHKVHGLLLQIH